MRKSRWFVLIAGVIALDQVTKAFFFDAECVLLPGALHLRGVRNTGAAFSMLSANPFLVALLSFGVIVVLVILSFQMMREGVIAFGLALMVGGAAGNLIDRLWRGYVVDFLELTFVSFPVFNIADAFITAGAILAAIGVLRIKEV